MFQVRYLAHLFIWCVGDTNTVTVESHNLDFYITAGLRERLTTKYHDYTIGDKSDEGSGYPIAN